MPTPPPPPDIASLAALPPELLQHVADLLPTPDVGVLRLTSTTLNAALADTFRREHFTRLAVVVSPAGLSSLAALAARPEIAAHVRSLRILPHTADDVAAMATSNALLALDDSVERDGGPLTQRRPRTAALLRAPHAAALGHAALAAAGDIRVNDRRLGPIFRAAVVALGRAHAARASAGYGPVPELVADGSTVLDDAVFALGDELRSLLAPALASLDRVQLFFGRCSADPAGWTHAVAFMRLCSPSSLTLRAVESAGHGPCLPATLRWMLDAPAPFARLQRLELSGYTELAPNDLYALLTKFPRLAKVTLEWVSLTITDDRGPEQWDGAQWRSLLHDLSAQHQATPLPIAEMHLKSITEYAAVRFVTGRKSCEDDASAYAADSGVHFPVAVHLPGRKTYRDMPAGGDLFARLAQSIRTPWYEPDSDGGIDGETESDETDYDDELDDY
ncbi:uncharacterized protein LOC62_07G009741 [Vanrija pseudolonga]|uniref:F-box domain-containing protein n=1 Tax=Vanrija pseudolonga TaxID=143232 RepID=A0AAF0YH13_9TREE|nr:hypothetical protein LOC62_07G009741 [Vanrija pseudolonga]